MQALGCFTTRRRCLVMRPASASSNSDVCEMGVDWRVSPRLRAALSVASRSARKLGKSGLYRTATRARFGTASRNTSRRFLLSSRCLESVSLPRGLACQGGGRGFRQEALKIQSFLVFPVSTNKAANEIRPDACRLRKQMNWLWFDGERVREMALPGSPRGRPLTGTIGRTVIRWDAATGKVEITAPAFPLDEKVNAAVHPKPVSVEMLRAHFDQARRRFPRT